MSADEKRVDADTPASPITVAHIGRRQLLAGALGLAGGTLVGCSDMTAPKTNPTRTSISTPNHHQGATSVPPGTAGRFAGDPGRGHLYYGASVMYSLSLPDLERNLGGTLTVRRSYFLPHQMDSLISRVAADHSMGRLPLVSTKVPGTWADVAAGVQDSWLRALLTRLGEATQPVMLALHHEPEDDTGAPGMTAQDWVRMQDHAMGIAQSLAPNTTIVPILMRWTFDRRSGRDPNEWLAHAAPVLGFDVYNSWAQPGDEWLSFEHNFSAILPFVGSRPLVVAEYGCRTDPARPGRAAQWMIDAFQFATSHNVVALSYFDSSLNSPDGSWVLDGERLQAMSTCLHSGRVVSLT